MRLQEYSVLFFVVAAVLTLLVASPALSRLLVYPRTEFFTEMWILGPSHKAEGYPFNITRGDNYNVFLGIGNRLGHFAYYLVEVKFRNQIQSAPNSFNRTSSSLPSLFNITAFVADEGTWELPLTLSFDYLYNQNFSRVDFYSLTLNNVALDLRSSMISLNSTRNVFLGNLFFELWIYNATTSSFRYHERSVSLTLNITV